MTNDKPPEIQPAQAQVMNVPLQVLLFVGDDSPHGVDVMFLKPGEVTPLGQCNIPKGHMVMLVPPPYSLHILGTVKQQAPQPGGIGAPGVPN